MPSSGSSFITVIAFRTPTLCFAPNTFNNIIKEIKPKNSTPRTRGFVNTGNNTDNESATMFIKAALPKMPHPKKYNQLIM